MTDPPCSAEVHKSNMAKQTIMALAAPILPVTLGQDPRMNLGSERTEEVVAAALGERAARQVHGVALAGGASL